MQTIKFIFTRKGIALIFGVIIIVFAAVFIRKSHATAAAPEGAPPPAAVSVATVQQLPVTEWDEFSGRVQAVDQVEVRPRVSGMIVAVHFDEGQLVKQGDPLFSIDPLPFQAELARAQAAQAAAQAQLALAQTDSDRNHRLIENHSIAQSELDQSNANLLEATANLKAADAAVQTAELNLGYCEITAPVTGRVSRAEITVGNLVGAGVTAPVLTTVVSVSPMYVEFDIDEQTFLRYAANGASGNTGIDHIPVSIGLANEEGYPREAHLKSIDNHLDTTSGTIRVRAVVDNASGELTPGMFARVRTGGSVATNAILIDDRAVGTDQDKKYVLVVDGANKVAYREVKLGPIVNGLRVVRSGLQSGEHIVVNGLQHVQPGAVVVPTAVAMDSSQRTMAKM
jgi:multidrug efflux system membrane fusion protein